MKKIIHLLPLFLGVLACGAQSIPIQDVGSIVNMTLTAVAQNNSNGVALQPTLIPTLIQAPPISSQIAPSALHYYWPTNLPEGFVLDTANSSASVNGFILDFINPSTGTISISGGEIAKRDEYCPTDSISQIIRGFDGCFPQSTGGGFSVQWKEGDFQYLVGGLGLSRELALQIAEQLESLNMATWQERLK